MFGRRIVTGHDARGRSVILSDERAPQIDRAGMRLTRLWYAPTPIPAEPAEADARGFTLEPPEGGSYCLIAELAPEDPALTRAEFERRVADRFDALGGDHLRVNAERHPRMHRTPTIDYVIVLKGRVTLLVDDGEVALEPYDVVVQQATNHAWVNHGPETVVIAAVLVGMAGTR